MLAYPRRWRVRCRVIKKNGEQCKNWAMRGGVVCNVAQHGAAFPSVRARAQERLDAMANVSLEEFRILMLPLAEKSIRFRAAKAALKISGLKTKPGDARPVREKELALVDDAIASLIKSGS